MARWLMPRSRVSGCAIWPGWAAPGLPAPAKPPRTARPLHAAAPTPMARLARVERLKAALVLALGVGTWQYFTAGVSILVVRQIPTLEAFHAAARMPSVYIPAALAGLGAAVVGRKRARDRNVAPLMLSLLVGIAGLVDLFVGIFPESERSMVDG